jgi:arylsulfatase A-like enzyme
MPSDAVASRLPRRSVRRGGPAGIGLLFAAALLAAGAQAAPAGERPNILFIAIDDLRPELGCYGAAPVRSPHLDAFARGAVLFEHAYCQFPLCAPSRASMLTGARPDSTGVRDLYSDFRAALPAIESLPQFFKNRGYYTDRFGKIFHIDDVASWTPPRPPEKFGPGDPAKRAPYSDEALNRAGWAKFDRAKAAGLTGMALERSQRGPAVEIAEVPDEATPDGRIADQAIAALRQRREDGRPFFLGVGFLKPHLPFVAPRKYWEMYDRAALPVARNTQPPANAPLALGDGVEFYTYTDVPAARPVPDDYARLARQGYYACVSFVDAQIGRLLAELDRLGLRDNTLVVVWGDHGFKLGEHGGWGKLTNFELDTRVPLIVRVPGIRGGTRVAGLVEAVDIYPTLVELAGFSPPPHLEGASFAPLLRDPAHPGKTAVFTECKRDGEDWVGYSMRTERYRITRWSKPGAADSLELYDHESDPEENLNLSGRPDLAGLQAELLRKLQAGWRRVPTS